MTDSEKKFKFRTFGQLREETGIDYLRDPLPPSEASRNAELDFRRGYGCAFYEIWDTIDDLDSIKDVQAMFKTMEPSLMKWRYKYDYETLTPINGTPFRDKCLNLIYKKRIKYGFNYTKQ